MREKSQYGKKNKAEIVKNKTEKVKNKKKIAPGRRPELRKMGRSNFSLMKRKIIMKGKAYEEGKKEKYNNSQYL